MWGKQYNENANVCVTWINRQVTALFICFRKWWNKEMRRQKENSLWTCVVLALNTTPAIVVPVFIGLGACRLSKWPAKAVFLWKDTIKESQTESIRIHSPESLGDIATSLYFFFCKDTTEKTAQLLSLLIPAKKNIKKTQPNRQNCYISFIWITNCDS